MAETPLYKRPLTYEELTDIIDLSLLTGQLLLQHGAEAARIEETVHRVGTGLGCNWMDVLVSPNGIVVTATSGDQFRTKIRRVPQIGVNMSIVARINDLSREVTANKLDRRSLRVELEQTITMPREYNRWLVVLMVGLACGAFSRLFGGDWAVFVMTILSASSAMFIRQELIRQNFNAILVIIATSFCAGIIASITTLLELSNTPEIALASAVLLLVPGVPLINATEDLIQGHIVIGITRGIFGAIVSLGIALGLLLAMEITGIRAL